MPGQAIGKDYGVLSADTLHNIAPLRIDAAGFIVEAHITIIQG